MNRWYDFNGRGGFKTRPYVLIGILCLFFAGSLPASEVIENWTPAQVVIREHPRTGKPFVSITKNGGWDPFQRMAGNFKRPDYRMLDPKIKSSKILYDGPYSSRKKVYILAASLAAVGTVSGAAVIATAPAATGAGAASGAGVYGAAGAGVAVGTISGSIAAQRSDPEKENYEHTIKSKELES